MERLNSRLLLDFLGEVDKVLKSGITLVAVGGTALTLLKAKASTIDVDFTIPGEGYALFKETLNGIPHGFKVDCWKDGTVFSHDDCAFTLPIRGFQIPPTPSLNLSIFRL